MTSTLSSAMLDPMSAGNANSYSYPFLDSSVSIGTQIPQLALAFATFDQVASLTNKLDNLTSFLHTQNQNQQLLHQHPCAGCFQPASPGPEYANHYMDTLIPPNIVRDNAAIILTPSNTICKKEDIFANAVFRYTILPNYWEGQQMEIIARGAHIDVQNLCMQPHITTISDFPPKEVVYIVENTQHLFSHMSYVWVGVYHHNGQRFFGYDAQWGDIILSFSTAQNDTIFPAALSVHALRLIRDSWSSTAS
ncbi:hypothetical protein CPB83DRAFT_900112 [Crepidotus variabilis]|uniref:Uncharacterized protein n=1 Tax=Crepidotus variabilis TaxID=179855 RepID=A0A9P6E3M9_9AGAR|nr:hypothetical protein CPB83DRAFT_900112 [Crepidotus variabilis]